VTTENPRIVEIDVARNLLLIRGAVPGAEGGQVVVRPGLKAARLAKRKTVAPTKVGNAPSKDPAKAGKK
jgi:large subunit ribosomal protein L3